METITKSGNELSERYLGKASRDSIGYREVSFLLAMV